MKLTAMRINDDSNEFSMTPHANASNHANQFRQHDSMNELRIARTDLKRNNFNGKSVHENLKNPNLHKIDTDQMTGKNAPRLEKADADFSHDDG